MTPSRVFALAATMTLPGHAAAWGDEGHEIVATIAYAHLTPSAKKKVNALLAADTDKLSGRDFATRATWADKWRDSNNTRYNATHLWHFVDIEIDKPDVDAACFGHPPVPAGTAASQGPANNCSIDKIDQFRAELKSGSTPQGEKILALKYLMHLVGDLHQPLHSADRHDRGGNDLMVIPPNATKPVKLHGYWDTNLVQDLGKDPKAVGATLDKRITKAKIAEWSKGTATDWAKEAYDKAKSAAYNFAGEQQFVDDHGGKGERLDAAYDKRALPVVREQLEKGGIRLAAVLNDALK